MSSGVQDPDGIYQDMNDHVSAERWLAAIVESSDDAILGIDLAGIITSWNAAATRIFGYEMQEAIAILSLS